MGPQRSGAAGADPAVDAAGVVAPSTALAAELAPPATPATPAAAVTDEAHAAPSSRSQCVTGGGRAAAAAVAGTTAATALAALPVRPNLGVYEYLVPAAREFDWARAVSPSGAAAPWNANQKFRVLTAIYRGFRRSDQAG